MKIFNTAEENLYGIYDNRNWTSIHTANQNGNFKINFEPLSGDEFTEMVPL